LHVEGDLHNEGSIDGTGNICVTGLTVNEGAIAGDIDFCDGTPTTSVPPIIDINMGTVEPSITFCATIICAVGLADHGHGSVITLVPVPAHGHATLTGPAAEIATIQAIDARGRVVSLPVRAGRIDLAGLSPGVYAVVLPERPPQVLRLVVE
jgi:hypothetical protein